MAGTKETLDVIEGKMDVIEETLDTLEHVRPGSLNLNGTTKGQQVFLLSAVALVGAAAGGAIVYFGLRKKLTAKFDEISKKEIADAKEHYEHLLALKERPKSPEEVLAELHGGVDSKTAGEAGKAFASYAGVEASPEAQEVAEELPVAPIEKKHNIFTDAEAVDTNVFDYQAELKIREENPERPYIISEEEFNEAEKEYENGQLTYYEGDDTLADEKDMTVQDPDLIVGDDNLMRFGYGSSDKNIVYIRNDEREVDFEVVRHEGKYQVVVLGFEDPDKALQHAHRPRSRRNWDDDD